MSRNQTTLTELARLGFAELGESSTRLSELDAPDRAVGTRLALPSQVNIQGQAIHFGRDSQLLAPNASVSVTAGNWVSTGVTLTALRATGGQIYFDPGALLDVAGSVDISAPMSQNILTLQLRGAELADTPLQRTGAVRGLKLTIDLRRTGSYGGQTWMGTPLGNVADASSRLRSELSVADIVAAEDTRRLHRLVRDLGVELTGRVVSYFEGNEVRRTPELIVNSADW